jgi:hypothetical protein
MSSHYLRAYIFTGTKSLGQAASTAGGGELCTDKNVDIRKRSMILIWI